MNPNGNSHPGDSLASLVHDLRQPLSNIALAVSYIELLLEPDQTRVREQIGMIQQQVERASDTLERALGARQADGQLEPSETILLRKEQPAAEA
jgi:signal transduction histidine kinase